jgi:hypothetical protein
MKKHPYCFLTSQGVDGALLVRYINLRSLKLVDLCSWPPQLYIFIYCDCT